MSAVQRTGNRFTSVLSDPSLSLKEIVLRTAWGDDQFTDHRQVSLETFERRRAELLRQIDEVRGLSRAEATQRALQEYDEQLDRFIGERADYVTAVETVLARLEQLRAWQSPDDVQSDQLRTQLIHDFEKERLRLVQNRPALPTRLTWTQYILQQVELLENDLQGTERMISDLRDNQALHSPEWFAALEASLPPEKALATTERLSATS